MANTKDKLVLKKVKHMLKNTYDKVLDYRANYYISKIATKHKKRNDRIRIGFLVQMPELWSKQESVYTAMVEDPVFEPYLIILPALNIITNNLGDYGEELNYFIEQCKDANYIIAWNNNKWTDIFKYDFDYLFYQRPYDAYLPKEYRSYNTMKHTKTCYIPYATPEMEKNTIYPDDFFRNLYFGFMEDQYSSDLNNKNHKHKNHISFYNAGYPVFEKSLKMNNNCRYNRVLWTPRWTYEKNIGGSHFFEYNDFLTNYRWNNSSLTIRPHPMMWDEFNRKGLLSKEQELIIKDRWKSHGIKEDKQKDLVNTIHESDILISDRSSVIPIFFLTGKPIIFCPYEHGYGHLFSSILPGVYTVKNKEELEMTLNLLLEKKDYKKKERDKIIYEKFHQHINATESIVGIIKNDYNCI